MLRVSSVVALVLLATPALADRSDADACARKLSGLSLQTYNASIGKAENGATLKQAIGSHLRPLVELGKGRGIGRQESRLPGRDVRAAGSSLTDQSCPRGTGTLSISRVPPIRAATRRRIGPSWVLAIGSRVRAWRAST